MSKQGPYQKPKGGCAGETCSLQSQQLTLCWQGQRGTVSPGGHFSGGVSREEKSWLCQHASLLHSRAQTPYERMVGGLGTHVGYFRWGWVRTSRKSTERNPYHFPAQVCLGRSEPATLCRLGNRGSDPSDWYLPLPNNH